MHHMNPRMDLYPENVSKIDKVKLYCVCLGKSFESPYTPNANMADHSDGPGLVAWKRGQSVCQSRLFPNVLIIANGCMCSD